MKFATRQAAWKAMLLRDHLRVHGVIQIKGQIDGSLRFYYRGFWSTIDIAHGAIQVTPMLIQTPKPVQRQVLVPGNAQAFDQRGDTWAGHNPQHDAHDHNRTVRRNAFGDICQKPTVEGYDEWAPSDWQTQGRKQAAKQAQMQAQIEKPTRDAARRLAVARMQFRKGK